MKQLDEIEVRVLGSLIEKQLATPEYYPLTMNALVRACNQLSNREPVVNYDERTVTQAIESLREKSLVYIFYGSDSRVPKYKQMFAEQLHLSQPEVAIICVLMLKGTQTVGELRAATNRLYEFADLNEVEATLEKLLVQDDPALVVRLPRRAGQKEARYAHLLSGEVRIEETEKVSPAERALSSSSNRDERIAALEAEVEALKGQLEELRRKFEEFSRQFE